MSDGSQLTTTPEASVTIVPPALHTLAALLLRYAITAFGPLSIAGAHFVAALIFLRFLSQADFGLFSFVLVIVPFFLSMTGALFGASLAAAVNRTPPMESAELAGYMKGNLAFAALAACVTAVLLMSSGAGTSVALLTGLYGGLMTMRWFARCYAYALHDRRRAMLSDLAYSLPLTAGLFACAFLHVLTPASAAIVLAVCAMIALLPFGFAFLRDNARALFAGSLTNYMPVWRDLARWSLLGVVSTELTANAHAYLVTFISGPKAFALLAVGSLFMRPASLILSTLPDVERPSMARSIGANNISKAVRTMLEFRAAALAVLFGTVLLSAVILIWFPQFVLKRGYAEANVIQVLVLWTAVMGVRAFRTPESVLLQAAGEFRSLAGASVRSSLVSVAVTLALLLAFGPLASLAGILIGELVMTFTIFALVRRWRARNG